MAKACRKITNQQSSKTLAHQAFPAFDLTRYKIDWEQKLEKVEKIDFIKKHFLFANVLFREVRCCILAAYMVYQLLGQEETQ